MSKFGTLSANGDTDEVFVAGDFILKASGTWGGGTLTASFRAGRSTYTPLITATALTSDATGQVYYDIPAGAGVWVKATLAGATTPSLNWEIISR